jgi:ABC-2 type transport system permease protein
MKTIYILWLRQLKRYVRSKSRIVGSLGQPVLYLISLGYGLGSVFERAGSGNYIQFLVPGIIGMSIIFTSIFSGMEIIWDRQFGFLKETLVAPVSRFEIMLGRTLGGATVATIQGILILPIALLLGFRPYSWPLVPVAIVIMFLTALLFTSFGTALASKLQDMQGFQLIMSFLVMPLYFLSGAIFPLEGVPKGLALVAKLDPLAYGIDAFRALLINTHHFALATDIIVLSAITLFFLVLGSWFFSKIQI